MESTNNQTAADYAARGGIFEVFRFEHEKLQGPYFDEEGNECIYYDGNRVPIQGGSLSVIKVLNGNDVEITEYRPNATVVKTYKPDNTVSVVKTFKQ